MKSAQEYLNSNDSPHAMGGFNSRLQGESCSESLDGARGQIYAERFSGWNLADVMIMKGKIFSQTEIGGKKIEFKCMPDGNAWCCVGPDFVDLQESDCYAFGDTRDEAIIAFSKKEINYEIHN